MTKNEFMRELRQLLSKIPEDERNDALNYYEDYFAEAGISDDMVVPASIGTPRQVAEKIIHETAYDSQAEQRTDEYRDMTERRNYDNRNNSYDNSRNHQPNHTDTTKLILGVLLIIITFPVWSGIVLGIVGLLFGIFAGLLGTIIGLGVSGIALIITAFVTGSAAALILVAGTGMLLLAVAIILVIPLVLYCGKFIPWLVRGIVSIGRSLLGKKEYIS